MTRAIRDYLDRFGYKVGFKPAGGISSAKQAMAWQSLMKEELGDEWLKNDLFRFGASSSLLDRHRAAVVSLHHRSLRGETSHADGIITEKAVRIRKV
jgi:deoxyribose-phosphate aldolase